MLNNIFQPYHTMQEINLDWILTKVKNILRFVPDDGAVGQILRRTAHGAEWSNEQGGGGAVDSVNGQTGTVVLNASDVGALPDTTPIPDSTSDLINDSGFVDAAGAAAAAPVQMVNGQTGSPVLPVVPAGGLGGRFLKKRTNMPYDYGWELIVKSDVGLDNVDNVQQYSATNPPPYPVSSVNGQTGTVVLAKSDIGLGNVDNVQQYSASNPPPYPVTSVNGQTGAVTVSGTLNPTRIAYAMGNGGSANINLDDYQFIIFACTNNTTRIYGTTVIPVTFIKNGMIDSVYVYGGSTSYLTAFSVNGLGGVSLSLTGSGIYGAIYGM